MCGPSTKSQGTYDNGTPKKQRPTYVFMKLHTTFEINYMLGPITGKLTKRDVRVQPKVFPYPDTKTQWAFIGTRSGFCPEA